MSMYVDTIANGGGTYNRDGTPYTTPDTYIVGLVDGTFRKVDRDDVIGFYEAVLDVLREFDNPAGIAAIGTWVDGDTIHVDPVETYSRPENARDAAVGRHQLAYFHLDTKTEVRVA